jgi:hypothetical protein
VRAPGVVAGEGVRSDCYVVFFSFPGIRICCPLLVATSRGSGTPLGGCLCKTPPSVSEIEARNPPCVGEF